MYSLTPKLSLVYILNLLNKFLYTLNLINPIVKLPIVKLCHNTNDQT